MTELRTELSSNSKFSDGSSRRPPSDPFASQKFVNKKMKPVIILLAALLFALLGFEAAQASLSPRRAAGTPGAVYLRAAQDSAKSKGLLAQSRSVVSERSSFSKARWERVPMVDAATMQASFEFARDEKPHTDEELRSRRATWLYPDDGCFVRAAVATYFIDQISNVKPMKIFAFDTLTAKTPNSPDGQVQWWYHVAPITKVVDAVTMKETFYVYDPALQPKAPMEVTAWLQAMNAPNAEVAICASDSYDPDSDCDRGDADAVGRAQNEASWFLPSEWWRLKELGRDPEAELFAKPPWL